MSDAREIIADALWRLDGIHVTPDGPDDYHRANADALIARLRSAGLRWDALMAPAPLTSAVDVTGTLVERAKALRADFDALRTEVQRIADDCGVRAVQRAGTTNPSSRAAFVIYDKIATELRAALSTPDTGSE